MTKSSHVEELRRKHQALERKVSDAQRSPGIDDLEIATLKKEKLRLKEQIVRYSQA